MSRSVNAATVAVSSSLKNAPYPGPCVCAWAVVAVLSAAGSGGCVCAIASGTRPAAAPAPTAAPIRNARRPSSGLLIWIPPYRPSMGPLRNWRVRTYLQTKDAPLRPRRQVHGPANLTYRCASDAHTYRGLAEGVRNGDSARTDLSGGKSRSDRTDIRVSFERGRGAEEPFRC